MGGIGSLGELEPEDLKWRNRRFFRHPDHEFITQLSEQATLRQIENVRNSDLRRLFDEFPHEKHLYKQCAHWAAAVTGKQYFPDANHRTAMLTLEYLLRENNIVLTVWPGPRYEQTIEKSKRWVNSSGPRRLDHLWRQDSHYRIWLDHFVQAFRY